MNRDIQRVRLEVEEARKALLRAELYLELKEKELVKLEQAEDTTNDPRKLLYG